MATHVMEDSITDVPEANVVDRVFEAPTWRLTMGLPPLADHSWPHRLRSELPVDPLTGRQRGDIDILTMPPASPKAAVAIEAKCVRVPASAFKTIEPNGLSNWRKGITQANKSAGLGFHKVYLYMFLLIDSREHNAGERLYRGATPELLERVYSALRLGELDPRVGVVQNQFVQPFDRPPFITGMASSQILRFATEVEQTEEITAWVTEQFRAPAI